MAVSPDEVRSLFKGLESGNGAAFFAHVADDVDWIVEGTHPLAGHYRSKAEFQEHTFAKLAKVLPDGAELHVTGVIASGDWAVVELQSMATAKNGLRFDNRYCWVIRFAGDKIVEVRAYLDSALVQRLFDENPI
jgi:ketosteroid isomerase-like protein